MILALVPGVASADHLTVCQEADEASFDDVAEGGVFELAIECVAGFGIVQGDGSGDFNPGDNVTRGQAAIFIANLIEISSDEVLPEADPNPFTDVAEGGVAESAILKLVEAGVVDGTTDTTFSPSDELTRGEMAQIVFNALDFLGVELDTTDNDAFSDADGLFADAINALANFEPPVVDGFTDGTYGGSQSIVRGELAQITVESVYQLDEAGLFAPTDDVVDANSGTVVNVTADTIADADDLADDFSFDTAAGVTVGPLTFGESTDSYTVDGNAATAQAFSNALTGGDAITVAKTDADADFDTFALTNQAAPTSGIAGAVGLATSEVSIVTAGNSVLNTFQYLAGNGANPHDLGGVLYTVDGASATLAQFEAALGHGDTLTVTFGDADNDNVQEVQAYAITNQTVSGAADTITKGAPATFEIGQFGDQPAASGAAVGDDTLFSADAAGDQFTVDGTTATQAQFNTALTAGDTVAYSRAGGIETFALTNVDVDTSFAGITADADAAAAVVESLDANTVATVLEYLPTGGTEITTFNWGALTTAPSFRVDGTVVAETEFEAALDELVTVGQPVSYDEASNTLSLTTVSDSGDLAAANFNNGAAIDTIADDYFDILVGNVVIGLVEADTLLVNSNGAATTQADYFVNGTQVTAAVYADYIDDIVASGDSAEAGGEEFRVTVTLTTTSHRLTTNNTI